VAKIKLTKNELKKQKDALKMYERYLPTLQLKKQQLQIEIRSVEARKRELAEAKASLEREFLSWIAVFGETGVAGAAGESAAVTEGPAAPGAPAVARGHVYGPSGEPLLHVVSIRTSSGNVAGVEIPVFAGADFELEPYDFLATPLWVDSALDRLKKVLLLDLESTVLDEQIRRLGSELKTTAQRVNLFEKVKIPEAQEGIRRIRIYLGDQQTAQVVRGKIAKRKVVAVASGGGATSAVENES
jgi:V/A-type H+-transporting ATPase subunit D